MNIWSGRSRVVSEIHRVVSGPSDAIAVVLGTVSCRAVLACNAIATLKGQFKSVSMRKGLEDVGGLFISCELRFLHL